MKLINADLLKQKYRDMFVESLVDKDRGIDLSEYAEEPSKSFYRFIDEMPTVDVFDKIRAEIELLSNANPSYWYSGDMVEREEVLDIIDKYRQEG